MSELVDILKSLEDCGKFTTGLNEDLHSFEYVYCVLCSGGNGRVRPALKCI